MKIKPFVSSLLLATAVITPVAHAEEASIWQKGAIITTLATAGTFLAGPIGLVTGIAAGDFVNQKIDGDNRAKELEPQLSAANEQLESLSRALDNREESLMAYEAMALQRLEFELFFRTADNGLNEQAQAQLTWLADYVERNPHLVVNLSGYADPRGDAAYNLRLSQARVAAVKEQLITAGISLDRITIKAYGDSLSESSKGDLDSFALDRKVTIEVTDMHDEGIARN